MVYAIPHIYYCTQLGMVMDGIIYLAMIHLSTAQPKRDSVFFLIVLASKYLNSFLTTVLLLTLEL